MTFFIATKNRKKLNEIMRILKPLGISAICEADLDKQLEDCLLYTSKTTLQEIIQQNPEEQLEYRLAGESGPDHDKRFEVEVLLNSNIIGRGEGHSKKAAEQAAAKEALKLMGEV